MRPHLPHNHRQLASLPLAGASRGLEKESLRIRPNGRIAQTPHPEALGPALTHPWITTDFSEAMLELVTPPLTSNAEASSFLADLHRYVYEAIGDELLWAPSMPCLLEGEESIPIAKFGASHSGRMREVYRRGLSLRYGRAMEVITGVHFNFSPNELFWREVGGTGVDTPLTRELRNTAFFAMMRNYRRWGWLLLYLFGASPAVCHTFFSGRTPRLPELLPGTHFAPLGTSLRMSDIGYRNNKQAGLSPSMNDLDSYLQTLARAVSTPDAEYASWGVEVNGEWRQLSANLLQIENELYGFVRPKQPVRFGERPSHALRSRGVSYVEVRALDVDPFSPTGLDATQLDFLEAFLWLCLLADSPPMTRESLELCDERHSQVAARGREENLVLAGGFRLQDWARELLAEMAPICDALDTALGGSAFAHALHEQELKVLEPERTPSARLLALIRRQGTSFFEVALELSRQHRQQLQQRPLDEARRRQLDEATGKARTAEGELSSSQTGSFGEFVAHYLG